MSPRPTKKAPFPPPPHIPTGQELYDAIMGEIEPELTTGGVKMLDEKYKNETPKERYERKKRYVLAFERYQQAYEDYVETLQAQVDRYQKVSREKAEIEDREQEEGFLNNLQSAFLKVT